MNGIVCSHEASFQFNCCKRTTLFTGLTLSLIRPSTGMFICLASHCGEISSRGHVGSFFFRNTGTNEHYMTTSLAQLSQLFRPCASTWTSERLNSRAVPSWCYRFFFFKLDLWNFPLLSRPTSPFSPSPLGCWRMAYGPKPKTLEQLKGYCWSCYSSIHRRVCYCLLFRCWVWALMLCIFYVSNKNSLLTSCTTALAFVHFC